MLSDLQQMGQLSFFKDTQASLSVPEEFPNELLTEMSEDVSSVAFKQWVSSVSLDLKPSQPENPWVAMAGEFKDDPLFEAMLTDIEDYRHAVDEGGLGSSREEPQGQNTTRRHRTNAT